MTAVEKMDGLKSVMSFAHKQMFDRIDVLIKSNCRTAVEGKSFNRFTWGTVNRGAVNQWKYTSPMGYLMVI